MVLSSPFSFLLSALLTLPSLLYHTARWHALVAARDVRIILALVSRVRRTTISALFGRSKRSAPVTSSPPSARDAGVSMPAAQLQPQHKVNSVLNSLSPELVIRLLKLSRPHRPPLSAGSTD